MEGTLTKMNELKFEENLIALRPELLRMARTSLHEQAAEDAVQLCLFWCWENQAVYENRGLGSLKQWVKQVLWKVVRNERRNVLKTRCEVSIETADPTTEKLITRLADEEDRERLWELIAAAELTEKMVIVLQAKLRGEIERETAEYMGITQQAVAGLYARAVAKIRDAHLETIIAPGKAL